MVTPRLRDVASELVSELQRLLTEQGEHGLAAQAAELAIVEHCPCGDAFCSTFYTAARPNGAYGSGLQAILLTPQRGMLIIDVVGSDIVGVEILYRDELRTKIRAAVAQAKVAYSASRLWPWISAFAGMTIEREAAALWAAAAR